MLDNWTLLQNKEIAILQDKNLNRFNIIHGFSTRTGGVSCMPFESLNLGLHVKDNTNDVIDNRKIFSQSLGLALSDWVTAEQVHGDNIAIVSSEDKGKGTVDYKTALANTDGMITNDPGVVLVTFYADCIPILILDPINSAIGLAHAGWKGTLAQIGVKTIKKMEKEYGTIPEHCFAAIGPGIGQCCYEVDRKVVEPIRIKFPECSSVFKKALDKDNNWLLDLKKLNFLQLSQLGIPLNNISVSKECTCCKEHRFFSYRRDGKTGRMAALITLKNFNRVEGN